MAGEFCRIAPDVVLGRGVRIHSFVNLYGCTVGDGTRLGTFVEIQKGATVGARCLLSGHCIEVGKLILGEIAVAPRALLAAEVLVGPSVRVGEGAMVKARAALSATFQSCSRA